MLRLIQRIIGILCLALVAFCVSWVIFMPNERERGVWLHEADGTILSLGHLQAKLYHQTSAGCVPTMSFPAHMALVNAMEGAWVTVDGDKLELHVDGNLAPAIFLRTSALPASCNAPIADSPDKVFQAMWVVMDEHYAFFDLHGVDWDARRSLTPPSSATDNELFTAMTTALAGLDDGHVQLIAGELGFFSPSVAPVWMPELHLSRDTLHQVARNAIGIPLTAIDRTGIEYGIRDDGIGYILITRMSTDPSFNQLGSVLAQESFAQVAANLAAAKTLIIDVRYNPGGDDGTAFAYAGHLTDKPVLALRKQTRKGDTWTAAIEATVQPRTPHLDQPVILLTSQLTGSGAEIFTMALREMPHVTVMGENTGGGLSDILGTTLPNGWGLGLSNQDYRTPDGTSYEGIGLPPDIALEMDGDALSQGVDIVLEAAIAHALRL